MNVLKTFLNYMAKEKIKKDEAKKKADKEETKEVVDSINNQLNPAFDPDIPEQKQRWFR